MNEIQQLKAEMERLKRRIDALEQTSTLPLKVEQTLQNRGFLHGKRLEIPLGFAIAGQGMNREISLTGNPQTITVLDYPYTFVRLNNTAFSPETDSEVGNSAVYVPVYIVL